MAVLFLNVKGFWICGKRKLKEHKKTADVKIVGTVPLLPLKKY